MFRTSTYLCITYINSWCPTWNVFQAPIIEMTVTFPRDQYVKYTDGLMQERRNSIANALELRLSCTNPFLALTHRYGDETACVNHRRDTGGGRAVCFTWCCTHSIVVIKKKIFSPHWCLLLRVMCYCPNVWLSLIHGTQDTSHASS